MRKKMKKVAKPVYLSMDAKIKKFQSELKRLKKQYKNEDAYSSNPLDAIDDVIVSFKAIFKAKKKKKDD